MHVYKIYAGLKTQKEKDRLLSKYIPLCREIIKELEHQINFIDSHINGVILTETQVKRFGNILTEMYTADIEQEIESMIVACKKLMLLKVSIWNKCNTYFY